MHENGLVQRGMTTAFWCSFRNDGHASFGTTLRIGRQPSMRRSEQYRQFAEDCLRLASQANNGNHRLALEEMAEAWSNLAEEAEQEDGA